MSAQDAKRFIEALDKDEKLLQLVNEASENIVKAAKKTGFEATREKISVALKQHWKDHDDCKNHPLSEAPGF